MSVRKAHNSGRNHLRNVVDYYQRMTATNDKNSSGSTPPANEQALEIGHEKAQSIIDSITSSYENAGQAASNPMLQQPGLVGPGAFPGGSGGPPPFPFPGNPGMAPPMPGNFLPPRPPGLPAHIPWPPPGLPFPPPFPGPGMNGSPMSGMPFMPPPGMPGMPPLNFPGFPPGQSQSPVGPPQNMGAPGFMPPGGHPPGQ